MSDNSFVIKKSLSFIPQATAPLNPTKGDMYKDLNNNVLKYNGSSWVNVGSGSGAGDLDTFYTETFDETATADFTHTGLVLDDVSPLNGTKSAKLTHQAAINQSFKRTIAVPEKYRGQIMTVALLAKSTANTGNLTILFRCETSNTDIQVPQQIQATSSPKTFQFGVKIPAGCLSFSYTITALPQSGSPVSYIDDISIRSYWIGTAHQGLSSFQVPNLVQTIQHTASGTTLLDAAAEHRFNLANITLSGDSIMTIEDDAANSRTKFVAQKDCIVDVSYRCSPNAVGHSSYITKNGSTYVTSYAVSTAGFPTPATAEIVLKAGDFITVASTTGINGDAAMLSIVAKASSNVLTTDLIPSKSMLGNASIEVPKIEKQFIYGKANSTNITQNVGDVRWGDANLSYTGDSLFSYDNLTGRFTALKDCTITMSVSNRANAIGGRTILYKNTTVIGYEDEANAQYYHTVTASASLVKGDYLLVSGSIAQQPSVDMYLTLIGTAYSSETKTWSGTQALLTTTPDSEIVHNGFVGAGSTNTNLGRFKAPSRIVGDAVTWVSDSVNGDRWIVNYDGVYHFSHSCDSAAVVTVAFSKNYSVNAVSTSIPAENMISPIEWETTGAVPTTTGSAVLKKGDVIRIHFSGAGSIYDTSYARLAIVFQGSVKQVETVSDQQIEMPTHELRMSNAGARGTTATYTVRFDSIDYIRGDAFEVVTTVADGTYIKIKKPGMLHAASALYRGANGHQVYITKNSTALTTGPTTRPNGEVLANEYSNVIAILEPKASVMVKANDIIRIEAESAPTAYATNHLTLCLQEQTVAVSVSNILPQYSEEDSAVQMSTSSLALGSSATTTMRFANVEVNLGKDIEYSPSTTLGDGFIAKTNGLYHMGAYISMADNQSSTVSILKNGNGLYADGNYTATGFGNNFASVNATIYLIAGDRITFTANSGTATGRAARMYMAKTGKPNVIANVSPFVNLPQPTMGDARFAGYNGASVSGFSIFDSIEKMNGNGIFVYDNTNGMGVKLLKRALITANIMKGSQVFSNNVHDVFVYIDDVQIAANRAGNGGSGNTDGTTASYSGIVEAGSIVKFAYSPNVPSAYGDVFCKANISAIALADQIITESDTYSTDTNFVWSAAYNSTTLKDAPVGTAITYHYGTASSNTPTQHTTRTFSQSDADIMRDGLLMAGRAYTTSHSNAFVNRVQIQIGKNLKGIEVLGFANVSRLVGFQPEFFVSGTAESGVTRAYEPSTGILTLDSGAAFSGSNSTRYIGFNPQGGGPTAGYISVNASRSSQLVGLKGEAVIVKATQTSGQSIASGTIANLIWDSAGLIDTTGSFNPATGIFTAPENGFYNVSASLLWASASWSAAQYSDIYILKNGVIVQDVRHWIYAALSSHVPTPSVSTVVRLNKGDTLNLQIYQSSGAAKTIFNVDAWNFLNIFKI